jgi:hypothetical protein
MIANVTYQGTPADEGRNAMLLACSKNGELKRVLL